MNPPSLPATQSSSSEELRQGPGIKACLLLGAGWSRLAGRPLASELFDVAPLAASASAAAAYDRVIEAWRSWHDECPGQLPEQFLAQISPYADSLMPELWPDVIRFIAARLGEPDVVRLEHELRYGERITKPSPAVVHHRFIGQVLEQYTLAGVVTTNFDLLAERTLRHQEMQRPPRPGFFYPGMDGQLQGATAFSVRHGWVSVTGSIPLCKLHGSLNWTREGSKTHAYADCRAAHRRSDVSFIVPPQPEKRRPQLLETVWESAEHVLRETEHLLVVGYSAPPYDLAVEELLRSTTDQLSLTRVWDLTEAVANRYREITGRPAVWEGPLTDDFTALASC